MVGVLATTKAVDDEEAAAACPGDNSLPLPSSSSPSSSVSCSSSSTSKPESSTCTSSLSSLGGDCSSSACMMPCSWPRTSSSDAAVLFNDAPRLWGARFPWGGRTPRGGSSPSSAEGLWLLLGGVPAVSHRIGPGFAGVLPPASPPLSLSLSVSAVSQVWVSMI